MMQTVRTGVIGALALCALGAPAAPAEAAELIATNGAWRSYRSGSGDTLVCFAVAAPAEQQAGGADRRQPHFYVTVWPKAGIKAEISVLVGATLGKTAQVGAEIGPASFALLAEADRAYVADEPGEQKLLEAMRRGRSVTISATAASGERLRDTYSLSGVTAAIEAAASACP